MTKHILTLAAVLAVFALSTQFSSAQQDTSPASPAESASADTTGIEGRTVDILKALALADATKSNQVHDAIFDQYHALRARDALIDAKLKALGKEINYANRASDLPPYTVPLHEQFLARLAANLTPEQIEKVKDKMTSDKVKENYDAYCAIVPNLTDADKAKILELLQQARDVAIDGGSAPEISDMFQVYKDQINAYLNANGHDTAKAFSDWAAKQSPASKQKDATAPAVPAAK